MMRIAVLSRDGENGGAAVAARRIAEALGECGAEAQLVTVSSGNPCGLTLLWRRVSLAAASVLERLQILFALLSSGSKNSTGTPEAPLRKRVWQLDTGRYGTKIWARKEVREADAVILNWTNQGLISLLGIHHLCKSGKKVVWVMHDMWPFTGVCHHSMQCSEYEASCHSCPYLGGNSEESPVTPLSASTWRRKQNLYRDFPIRFVAVSNWIASRAVKSSLLSRSDITVIPNPISPISPISSTTPFSPDEKDVSPRRILFAAAVIDNWIKGFPTFREAVSILASRPSELPEEGVEVVLLGDVKDAASLDGFSLPVRHLGLITDEEQIAAVFDSCDVVVNCSMFENLPTTLVEGQAYGAVPVAFDRGGQRDIIDHLATGYLASWSDSPDERARQIADGIIWALANSDKIKNKMRQNIQNRFSYLTIGQRYMDLLKK